MTDEFEYRSPWMPVPAGGHPTPGPVTEEIPVIMDNAPISPGDNMPHAGLRGPDNGLYDDRGSRDSGAWRTVDGGPLDDRGSRDSGGWRAPDGGLFDDRGSRDGTGGWRSTDSGLFDDRASRDSGSRDSGSHEGGFRDSGGFRVAADGGGPRRPDGLRPADGGIWGQAPTTGSHATVGGPAATPAGAANYGGANHAGANHSGANPGAANHGAAGNHGDADYGPAANHSGADYGGANHGGGGAGPAHAAPEPRTDAPAHHPLRDAYPATSNGHGGAHAASSAGAGGFSDPPPGGHAAGNPPPAGPAGVHAPPAGPATAGPGQQSWPIDPRLLPAAALPSGQQPTVAANGGTVGPPPGYRTVPVKPRPLERSYDPVDPLAPQVYAGDPAVARDNFAWVTNAELVQQRPEPAIQIDYELVAVLQAEVSRQVIEALRGEASVSNEERRRVTRELTDAVVRRNVDQRLRSGETGPVTWPGYERALASAVAAYLIGLGRLQPLIDDPEVENIMVLGTRVRVVFANGVIDETSFSAAASDAELISLLQRLAERGGQTERSLSAAKPILHLRLPDGARLTVIYQVTSRPVVVIRRHRVKDVSLSDLVHMEAITPTLRVFLEAAIAAHMNVMIAGRANSGKTTLLRAMADEIPREEWFAVMETVGELGLDTTGRHPWAICFEEREGFGEKGPDGRPEGELTIDDLFPHMLRLSTTRIIVGEVRAQEIVAMFDAMNTTYGSLCTIHSRDEHGVFDRLAELLLRYGASKNREGAYLTIGNALDFVVYVNMEETPGRRPRRYVSSVMEVHGLGEGSQLARSRIFAPGPGGLAVPTGVRPSERHAAELQRVGFDMRLLLGTNAFQGVPQ